MRSACRVSFPVVVNGLTGFVDSTGRMIIQPRFGTTLPFTEGLAAVQLAGVWGYIDTIGAMVIQPRCDYASAFSNHPAWVPLGSVFCSLSFVNLRRFVARSAPP